MTEKTLKALIIANSAEINRLHGRLHAAHRLHWKDKTNDQNRQAWTDACQEFHERYPLLCLPLGWEPAFLDKVLAGEREAVERALCYLEVRPYFFRSGYHWKMIFQKCKRAPLVGEQALRLATLVAKYREWKASRYQAEQVGAKVRNNLSGLLDSSARAFAIDLPDRRLASFLCVGDLYTLVCTSLKIQPHPHPEQAQGNIVRNQEFTSGQDYDQYLAWKWRIWTPEDVWATLASLVTEAFNLDPTQVIVSEMPFATVIQNL